MVAAPAERSKLGSAGSAAPCMMPGMRARSPIAAAIAAALLVACGAPSAFRVVSLETARTLVRQGDTAVLDTLGEGERATGLPPGGVRWRVPPGATPELPELPPTGVLVVASEAPLAYRSAAALVRAGHRPVYVFVTASADERRSLYALEPFAEETQHGRDS